MRTRLEVDTQGWRRLTGAFAKLQREIDDTADATGEIDEGVRDRITNDYAYTLREQLEDLLDGTVELEDIPEEGDRALDAAKGQR